jgi:hypothetical protein
MNKLLCVCAVAAAMLVGAGCSKKRVAECDDFVETVEKIAKCDKLPEDQRKQVADSGKTIKDALQMIDDAGGVGDAPQDLVKQLRDTCKTQNTSVTDTFKKLQPDCMK